MAVHPGRLDPAAAAESLAPMFERERQLQFGRDGGLDLTDRDQLLDAAAVGLTVLLWRNTSLEDAHSGWRRNGEATAVQFQDALVSSGHEVQYLRAVAADARAGWGIPDTEMMRINVATATSVRVALDAELPKDIGSTGCALPVTREGAVPEFLIAAIDVLDDSRRAMAIGPEVEWTPLDVLTANRLKGMRKEREQQKPGMLLFAADYFGAAAALRYIALSGVAYASDWFPNPSWAEAVAALRDAVRRKTVELYQLQMMPSTPDADDDQFWDVLKCEPNRLTTAQVQWAFCADVSKWLRQARAVTRAALGGSERSEFNATLAAF